MGGQQVLTLGQGRKGVAVGELPVQLLLQKLEGVENGVEGQCRDDELVQRTLTQRTPAAQYILSRAALRSYENAFSFLQLNGVAISSFLCSDQNR